MDDRLVGWARAVKSRRSKAGAGSRRAWQSPVLWLFTDAARMPDVVAVVRGLPAGLCGVVFRHDRSLGRAETARLVWQECRRRRLAMVVAGARVGFHGPGRHLRGGCGWAGRGLRTASAHSVAELVRARRRGADLVFLSPLCATASHIGGRELGAVRWSRLAQRVRIPVLALGGVDGVTARQLPRWVSGVGAIGALAPR